MFAVLAAMSTAAVLATGCSSSKQSGKPLPDAATLLKESSQTTKNVTSVHLALSVTGKVKGLPIKTVTGDLTTKPNTAAKGNADITFAGSQVDADFVVYSGTLYAALTPGKWSDFGPAADIYDPSTILDPKVGLAHVLTTFTDPKADGRDTVNGQDTVRVTGTVPSDAVNQLVPQLTTTQSVPATAWIQENGDHQLVQAKLEPSSGNFIQMTLSNWNEPVHVSKPPVS